MKSRNLVLVSLGLAAALCGGAAMAQDSVPKTGQAVIIDIGEASDIHPRNKLEVARRLARWALAEDYGKDLVHDSPQYDSMVREGDQIVVTLKNTDGGLRTIDNNVVEGFAIAGADKKWVWADAKILDKHRIEVSSDMVAEPVAVRYAWADNPVCNLYNMSGLPVTPFRTDDWPGVTAEAR